MKGQNFASRVLSRHTFRISRKKGSDFFDHRGTLKQCIIKQLLDSVFVISEIIKVSVSVISVSVISDYFGYHKNLIQ